MIETLFCYFKFILVAFIFLIIGFFILSIIISIGCWAVNEILYFIKRRYKKRLKDKVDKFYS